MLSNNTCLFYLEYTKELWSQCEATENQRFVYSIATVTINLIFLIMLKLKLMSYQDTILFQVVLSTLSILLMHKLYERWKYTRSRLHVIYEAFDKISTSGLTTSIIRTNGDNNYKSIIRGVSAQILRDFLVVSIPLISVFNG